MSKIKLVFWFILFSFNTYSQLFEWAESGGALDHDRGEAIAIDSDGNTYTTGIFGGTVDFDPGISVFNLTSVGGSDVYVLKLDNEGNFIWAKSFGGESTDYGFGITTDSYNNVIITGYFDITADFDPSIDEYVQASNGASDIYIVKLNEGGDFIWARTMGGPSTDVGLAICTDNEGNIFTAGHYRGIVDFDPGEAEFELTSSGQNDVFVQKLNAEGNLIWVKSMGSPGSEFGNSVAIDQDGNCLITGGFSNTGDFDPNEGVVNITSNGGFDIFIVKLDLSGNLIWVKSIGGPEDDMGYDIIGDESNNIYVTGRFGESVDFNPDDGMYALTALDDRNAFILKLSDSGTFNWAKSLNSANGSSGQSIAVDLFGNPVVIGYYLGTTDFNPGDDEFNLTALGSFDIFVVKLSESGDFKWAKSFGGYDWDIGLSIVPDNEQNLYFSGSFRSDGDFDPNEDIYTLISNGQTDFCIVKMQSCVTTYSTDYQEACNSFIWLDGNEYFEDESEATFTLFDVDGCDSIITLNLTINTIDNSVFKIEPTIYCNEIDAIYQWLDCEEDYSPILGSESNYFSPVVNGNYAVEISKYGCVDTSECITISTVSIDDLSALNTIIVHPNPTNGLVNINIENYEETRINIYSTDGQLIQSYNKIKAPNIEIILNAPAGLYFIEILTNDQKQVIKLIKE